MVVIDSLHRAVSLLRRRPKLFVLLFALSFVGVPSQAVEYLPVSEGPALGITLLSLVLGPAATAAILGLVDRAAEDGRVSLGVAADAVAGGYLSIVGAGIAVFVGALAVALALVVLSAIPLINVLAILGFLLLAVAAGVTLQFVDAAIVIDGKGAVPGIRRSFDVTTAHPGAVVGYTMAQFLAVLALLLPLLLALLAGDGASAGSIAFTPGVVGGVLLLLLVSPVFSAWRATLYRELSARTADRGY